MVILILIGYLFLDKVDALPSLEKVAKALDKVTLFFCYFDKVNRIFVIFNNDRR